MKAYKKTLPNGVRLITVPMKDTANVAIYVFTETGTKYETKDINGISHFLEHVCFKGTEKRPNSIIINTELDSIGAQTNAFTSHEFTGYYAKAHSMHTEKIMDVLSDMYLHSTFPKADVEKEKGVILEEINMYEDNPQAKAGRLIGSLMYGDQPAGWTVLGRKEVIKRITPEDFREYRRKHYVASSTIIVVAGKLDQKNIDSLVKKYFEGISTAKKFPKKKVVERQSKPSLLVAPKKSDQTHVVIGVRSFPVNDKRSPALALLNTVLGRGMSSRLFHKLREEMGICYYVRSGVDDNTDHGALIIRSGVDTKRVPQAVSAILGELRRFTKELVSDKELEKAKEYAIGSIYLGLETSDALAEYYGLDEIVRHKLTTPSELEKEIRKVTAKDIKKVAQDIFKNKNLNLVVSGKSPTKKSLEVVLKF